METTLRAVKSARSMASSSSSPLRASQLASPLGAVLDWFGFQRSGIGQWAVRTLSGEGESIFEGIYTLRQRLRGAAGSMAEACGWGKLLGMTLSWIVDAGARPAEVDDSFQLETVERDNGSGVARSVLIQMLLSGGVRVKGLARAVLPDAACSTASAPPICRATPIASRSQTAGWSPPTRTASRSDRRTIGSKGGSATRS